MPVPVSPNPRALSGTKPSSLPGTNTPSPSSLQPITEFSLSVLGMGDTWTNGTESALKEDLIEQCIKPVLLRL